MYLTLLYSCDTHHTRHSKFLHGVFSSSAYAMDALVALLEKAGRPELSEDDTYNLGHLGQTQGYAGAEEFMFEYVTLDDIDVWL